MEIYFDRGVTNRQEVLYRATGGPDDVSGGQVSLWCMAYQIVRRTPCGAWIKIDGREKLRFVNLQAVRRWATETTDEAIQHLRYRKLHQIRICTNQIACANMTIEHIDSLKP